MYQSVTLVGNISASPELRYTPSGQSVASFSLATNRVWVDAGGTKQTKTIWVRVTCWRKLAETAAQYLTKGAKVLVIGELEEPRAYTAKDGTQRASLEVTAHNIKFLDSRGDSQGNDSAQRPSESLTELEELPF